MQQIIRMMVISVMTLVPLCRAQESQSLGDAARVARQQKKLNDAKRATADAKGSMVITEDQIPEHPELSAESGGYEHSSVSSLEANDPKMSAEEWKAKIQEQQNQVRAHEAELSKLNESIHFAPGNCVTGCVQWNERQKQKQDQAERLQTQLDEEKKSLEEMQEGARQQGYGSSVYEP